MSSLQALAPIVGTALYTGVYNATADLRYPWQASYLLNSAGLFTAGKDWNVYFNISFWIQILAFLLTLLLYLSLGCKQITSEEDEEVDQKESANLHLYNVHPDDLDQKNREIYCTAYTNNGFS